MPHLYSEVVLSIVLVWGPGAVAAQGDEDDSDPQLFDDVPLEARDAIDMPVESAEPERDKPPGDRRVEWFGDFELELRFFPRAALAPGQPDRQSLAFAFRPGFAIKASKALALRTVGFVRLDENDTGRSTADVREARAELSLDEWTLTLGINKVFWGVTESRHLVDVVNQIDYREDLDGDERLGQLMAMASYQSETLGLVDVFVMSWFRPQTYPGTTGRPGLSLPVLTGGDVVFESSLGRWHPDVAVRWSRNFGGVDAALSYFYGTSREPQLRLVVIDGAPALQPTYDLTHQPGIEIQWTKGSWLAKLEGIARFGQGARFVAATGGIERTVAGLPAASDLTLFLEYSYDGRDNETFTFFDNDVFAALRLSLNDVRSTETTLGALIDVNSGDTFGVLKISRRLAAKWKASLEARLFRATDANEPLYWFRRDHYLEVELRYYY